MSVLVQYTIPGWQPSPVETRPIPEATAFRAQIASIATAQPATIDALLGLDHPQPGELDLPVPPRPAGISYADAAEDRGRWRAMLNRHASSESDDPRANGMLTMLAQLQELEDQAITKLVQGGRR